MPSVSPVLLSDARVFAAGLIFVGSYVVFAANDTVCLVLTPLVLRVARRFGLSPVPYVIAVATASNIGSTAAVGAALLLVTRTVDPRRVYGHVDWGLLVFFTGLFVIVGGAERAGLTTHLLSPMRAWNLHQMSVFVPVTAVFSNLVGNVPAVMLLRTLVPGFPDRLACPRDVLDPGGHAHQTA